MKNFTRQVFGVLLLLVGSGMSYAQETQAAKVVIVQKVAKADGSVNITKKEITEDELAKQLETLKTTNGENVEIHLTTKEGENIRISKDEDGTLLYFRNADMKTFGLTKISDASKAQGTDKIQKTTENWNQNWNQNWGQEYKNESVSTAGRPILGIYPSESHDGKGVVISSLSNSKGAAAAAGLKAGDVLTAIDEKVLTEGDGIRAALANHKPGDKVMVQYLRDGQPAQAEVTLVGEGASRVRTNEERDPCRVFIGVGTSTRDAEGLHVDYIVENTPAEVSDVRAGDVIVSLDNVVVKTQNELEIARDKHQPGEAFRLNILREGKPMTINARFKECSAEQLQQAKEAKERKMAQAATWRSFENAPQRDTCKVFIGVYTHEDEQGMRVNSVIENTPAKRSGVQKGDVIVALDDAAVNSHSTLLSERNKHDAGDRFTLSILRQGQYLEIDAQFKACGQQAETAKEEIAPVLENVTIPETTQPIIAPKNQLEVATWNAYPNPTFGAVNVQFKAEATPTTVQIFDAVGKKIYEEQLNTFDGFYNKQLNLGKEQPGVFLLTVRQGQKVYNNKLVLLSKA